MEFARPEFFKRNRWAAYPTAVVLVAIAVGITSLLWLAVDRPVSAPIFLAAVVVATLIGGLPVGVFTAMLSGLALDYFFIQPFYELTLARDDAFRWVFFVAEGSFVSWITEKLRVATADLKQSREELRELSRHQQTLREEEQKRIARDIHDELGQTLTGLKLDIHLMKKKVDAISGNGLSADLEGLSSHVDSTIVSVRRIASEIRPSILDDFGLIAALEWQAGEFERKFGVTCSFASSVENVDIEPEAGAAVFRIVQEAMTNIIRHAEATEVDLAVSSTADEMTVNIKDNGRGIELERLPKKRSLGIIGMRERARLIGADLDIRRRARGGTTVELFVPIRDVASEPLPV
ncbi:MAG: sensor histidine kinase [Acidobacteria bacterium]|nr:sensor histidine kinase [Acidobacteriota bacterium]